MPVTVGTIGNDTLVAPGPGLVFGGDGNDVIHGSSGNDAIYGDITPQQAAQYAMLQQLGARNYVVYYGTSGNSQTDVTNIAALNTELAIIATGRVTSLTTANATLLHTAQQVAAMQTSNIGKQVFGYLDVAKINLYDPHFIAGWINGSGGIADQGILFSREGSSSTYQVRYDNPEWTARLITRVIDMVDKGYNGVFLDDFGHFYQATFSSQSVEARAIRDIVIALRSAANERLVQLGRNPDDFKFVVNGGPDIIDYTSSDGTAQDIQREAAFYASIDAVLVESLFMATTLDGQFPAAAQFGIDAAISRMGSRGIALLSLDRVFVDQNGIQSTLTPAQLAQLALAASSNGFLPYETSDATLQLLPGAGAAYSTAVGAPGQGRDIVSGGAGDDLIYGGANNDTLLGGDGNDQLFGGVGSNTFQGGTGNDIYIVSATTIGDAVLNTLFEVAGEGNDEVRVTASVFSLEWFGASELEGLTVTDNATHAALIGNAFGNAMTGGTGVDDLFGRAGNDTLRGGSGSANTLLGQEGDDVYIVQAAGDSVIEFANEGTDTVRTALGSFTLRDHVENLTYTGSSAFVGVGSDGTNNQITGGAGDDSLNGMGGNDVLVGGSGADLQQGGSGNDQFSYLGGETGLDRILDFTSGSDRIALATSGFTRTATIDFVQSGAPAATSTNSTFLYNVNNGILSYDPDGTGATAPIQLAQLNAGLTLAAGDFVFV